MHIKLVRFRLPRSLQTLQLQSSLTQSIKCLLDSKFSTGLAGGRPTDRRTGGSSARRAAFSSNCVAVACWNFFKESFAWLLASLNIMYELTRIVPKSQWKIRFQHFSFLLKMAVVCDHLIYFITSVHIVVVLINYSRNWDHTPLSVRNNITYYTLRGNYNNRFLSFFIAPSSG